MFGNLSTDPHDITSAVTAHHADRAYTHMLAREKRHTSVGNRHGTPLSLYDVYTETVALDLRRTDKEGEGK